MCRGLLAVEEGFFSRVQQVVQRVGGDFMAAPVKSFGRMVAKLTSGDDHRYETMRPRAALNVDVVRCLVTVPQAKDIAPLLGALQRPIPFFSILF